MYQRKTDGEEASFVTFKSSTKDEKNILKLQ